MAVFDLQKIIDQGKRNAGGPPRRRPPAKKRKKPPPTTGILARTQSGETVRLAGPPRPVPIGGGRYILPETEFSPRIIRASRASPQRRIEAPPRRSGVSAPGGTQALSFMPGAGPISELSPRSAYKAPPGPWRGALEMTRRRREIEASIRRANYRGPAAYFGRTISNSSQTVQDIITGLPAASVRGVELVATAVRAVGKDPTAGPGDQIEAAKVLGREGKETLKYYGGLGKDFATRPAWAFENRLVEGALAVGLGWSAGGQGVRLAASQAAPVGRVVRGKQQTGSLRGGIRVARAQGRADTIAMDRALIARADRSRPAGAPTVGTPARSYTFQSSDAKIDLARRGAEVTGNVVDTPALRRLGRIADFGSRSTLPGGRRFREDRTVAAPARDRRRNEIGPVDAQGNFVGPRPSYTIPMRPRSSNPLTQVVQRAITEPAGRAVRRGVDAAAERTGLLPDGMSRAVRAQARNMSYLVPENTDRRVLAEAGGFAKMVANLRARGTKNGLPESESARGATAAAIRAMGAAESLGGSMVWGRDELIKRTRKTLDDPKANLTRRRRNALEGNLRTLESIPNEWLDPASAPKWLNDLDAEARRILSTSSKIKREMGLISATSAAWGGMRAQAQLMGARPVSRVRGEVYAGPKADMRMAAAIREEITFRKTRGRQGTERNRFTGYTTQALEVRAKALERRAKTIRRRVKPYIRSQEANALRGYGNYQRLESTAAQRVAELRALQARRDGSAFDEPLEQAIREREAAVASAVFERDRAAARLRAARQGRVAMTGAAAGRARRAESTARKRAASAAPSVRVALGRKVMPAVRASGRAQGARRVRTPAEDLAARQYAEARGNLAGTPRQAKGAETRVQRLRAAQSQDRRRSIGTPAQIASAARVAADARRSAARERQRALRTAYVDGDLPMREGMRPGEYFPQRSTVQERRSNAISPTGGAGARMAPPPPRFNAAVLADQGDISFSPREIVRALREAVDAQERVQIAAAVITRFAVRDGDRALEGDAAIRFADANGGDGNIYTVISERQLARISSLSSDSEAGRRLMRDLEESINPQSERQFVVPTAAVKGWTDALGPASAGFRWVDSVNSLWKGGVLALNPRWYLQNFFGMWGQFALGAGADLQAINMARSPAYRDAIPGRISMMGLSQDFGEYARRMEGQNTNWLGSLIRGGYYMNSHLEGVPRRAMFWHAAKKGLRENDFIKAGVMDEGYLARAWLDVAESAKRGDPGANRILDDVIVETERFMGNYARYNAIEKNFLRRVFPFYGWMRSINRLAFALPVKHPKRAAILSMASLMAFEDQGLERNDTTGYQSGLFVGNRLANMNTMNPFATTLPTWQAGKEIGRGVEELRPNPLSFVGLAGRVAFDGFVAGVEQAGPIIGNPYTMVSGETPSGIPLQFSPGYQGYIRNPVGRSDRIDPTTGKEESGSPIIGPVRAAEQLFPLAGAARRLLSDNRRPYANVTSLDIARWRFGGRDPKKAPFLFQNEPKTPRPTETDLVSFLSGFFGGVALDKVDPRAIQMREQESFKKMYGRLTSAQKRVLLGQEQERQRQRRQG